jgi:hypothetical protein
MSADAKPQLKLKQSFQLQQQPIVQQLKLQRRPIVQQLKLQRRPIVQQLKLQQRPIVQQLIKLELKQSVELKQRTLKFDQRTLKFDEPSAGCSSGPALVELTSARLTDWTALGIAKAISEGEFTV